MTPQNIEEVRLELTRLIGKKELTFGCKIKYDTDEYIFLSYTDRKLDTLRLLNSDLGIEEISEDFGYGIIGHPATLTDLHRFIISNKKFKYGFSHYATDNEEGIEIRMKYAPCMDNSHVIWIPYDSSLGLLEQSENTLSEILALIKSNQ